MIWLLGYSGDTDTGTAATGQSGAGTSRRQGLARVSSSQQPSSQRPLPRGRGTSSAADATPQNPQTNEELGSHENRESQKEQRRRDENDEQLCVICLAEPRSHAFVPCGHRCVCTACAEDSRSARKCPMCKGEVSQIIKIYG